MVRLICSACTHPDEKSLTAAASCHVGKEVSPALLQRCIQQLCTSLHVLGIECRQSRAPLAMALCPGHHVPMKAARHAHPAAPMLQEAQECSEQGSVRCEPPEGFCGGPQRPYQTAAAPSASAACSYRPRSAHKQPSSRALSHSQFTLAAPERLKPAIYGRPLPPAHLLGCTEPICI